MNHKNIEKNKLRSRLVRKGIFTQLPLIHKDFERENRMFRTIIDHTLFEATSKDRQLRKEAFKFFNPESSCANHFNDICEMAGLYPTQTRVMMLTFLNNFFPEVFAQTSCSFNLEVIR